jgi:hypothetical protein
MMNTNFFRKREELTLEKEKLFRNKRFLGNELGLWEETDEREEYFCDKQHIRKTTNFFRRHLLIK